MIEQVEELAKRVRGDISACTQLEQLTQIEVQVLGKKGELTAILKNLKNVPAQERKAIGGKANQTKVALKSALDEKKENLLAENPSAHAPFDITLPGTSVGQGSLHPITQLMYELNDAFHSLGFEVCEGPEISSESYAFDALNFPPEHPARESMDTYWVEGLVDERGAKRMCLRPHLTGMSVRYMQTHQAPFKFVYPGRVYRNEATDASHERAFSQYEALIIDKKVPFSSVRVMVNTVLERIYGREIPTRMRSGFFPFVEPGFEIDMQCQVCAGKGCRVCKQVGWIEIMPGGTPHPNVLKAGGLDPNEWQGMYLNIGLDRLVMMKYAIEDVRHFRSGDLRFLQQFR